MFIDSHCHLDKLDLALYENSFDNLLAQGSERGVERMLCVSVDAESFVPMYELIAPYKHIDASFGVHPLHIKGEADILTQADIISRVSECDKVVAIGETGLDYYYDEQSKALQQQSFINHLQAAKALGLPVIVHTRQAREDTIELIASHGAGSPGVLHCFTESLAMAEQALELNYFISFSGIVTFKNAQSLRDVVKAIPLERILIETDAPYLAPMPYRGKENHPKYVVEVAQCIADLKGLTLEALADITKENYSRCFNLP
ncbi:MAG: TatD family hydrolase [Pseudomonadales bacterium]